MSMKNKYQFKTQNSKLKIHNAGPPRNGANTQPRARRRASGQVIPIIALALLVLVGIVGLAVDGGSIFGQRRKTQNASDGAALASTRQMLQLYRDMIEESLNDRDGFASEENLIKQELDTAAAFNGIDVNAENVKAYFVNDRKQIVTSYTGGENGCGGATPCQVGDNNRVPWLLGAKGIMVTTQSATGSFFMAIFGHNEVSSSASATAYMGIAADSRGEAGLLPIGFFTETESLENLEVGTTYTLIQGSTSQGSGQWGYVDFNGDGNNAPVVNAWIACGFNPAIREPEEWEQWCTVVPHNREERAVGPIEYWTGPALPYEVVTPDLEGPYESDYLEWPADPDGTDPLGWWMAGSSGTTMSTCQFFQDFAAETENNEYYIPVFDRNNGLGGNNTKFHIIGLARFRIEDSDIDCNNGGNEEEHWAMRGTYLSRISTGGVGRHGDVRHTSNPTVFLEP